MFTKRNLSPASFFLLFLFVNLFWLIVLIYHSHSTGLNATVGRLQDKLQEASVELHETTKQFAHFNNEQLVHMSNWFILENKIDGYRLYRNDSLFQWSDNDVCFPILDKGEIGNGYFSTLGTTKTLLDIVEKPPFKLYLFKKVYHQYPVENGFLRNGFVPEFSDGNNLVINFDATSQPVCINEGVLFFVSFKSAHSFWNINQWLIFVWILLDFILLVSFLFSVSKRHYSGKPHRKTCFRLVTTIGVWGLFGSILHILNPVLSGDLFKPLIFASGWFNPNLAVLSFNIVFLFILAVMLHAVEYQPVLNKRVWRRTYIWTIPILIIGGFRLMISGFHLIIHHSNLPLDTNSIPLFNEYSLLVYTLLFLLYLVWFLPAFSMLKTFDRFSIHKRVFVIIDLAVLTAVSGWFVNMNFISITIETVCAILIFTIVLFRHSNSKSPYLMTLPAQLVVIGAAAFLISSLVTRSMSQKEMAFRYTIAEKYLLDSQDRIAERHLLTLKARLIVDTTLQRMASQYADNELLQDQLNKYLHTHYFDGYLRRFNSDFTFCLPADNLLVPGMRQPVSCKDFFRDKSYSAITKIDSSMLWFFGYTPEHKGYLARYEVPFNKGVLHIYAELVPRGVSRGIGLPEISGHFSSTGGKALQPYSYARYWDTDLMSHAGAFPFWRQLPISPNSVRSDTLFNTQNWSHLVIKAPGKAVIIISLPLRSWLISVSLFSYIFLGYCLLMLISLILMALSSGHGLFIGSFRSRFQLTVFLLILFSLVTIGISSVYFVINLNERKNQNLISDKAHSILIELQHKLLDANQYQFADTDYLGTLMTKFSEVFFTDINLYDPRGYLIATSQSDAFDAEILAQYMDGNAFRVLIENKESMLVHDEMIGDLKYLSAYLPLTNSKNDVLAYLNLPSFSRQEELQAEIGSFLITIINIYAIVLLIAAITGLIVARILTHPLQILAIHLSSVKIGKTNRKIEWQGSDELAVLISEYNRMLDELDSGTVEIKIREREATWNEMARQVAHEIKNPLTPLRLNVQYLQKAWVDGAPDFDQRLQRFIFTMQEQIERLNTIATDFGQFGSLPKPRLAQVDLCGLLRKVIFLFSEGESMVKLKSDIESCQIISDEGLLQVVFTNLIKNAIQAVPVDRKADVSITLSDVKSGFIEIQVADNGRGIPVSEYHKIFTPYFTTKSQGSGIGLHLVYQIVNALHGKVWFVSEAEIGTIFFIALPAAIESFEDESLNLSNF